MMRQSLRCTAGLRAFLLTTVDRVLLLLKVQVCDERSANFDCHPKSDFRLFRESFFAISLLSAFLRLSYTPQAPSPSAAVTFLCLLLLY